MREQRVSQPLYLVVGTLLGLAGGFLSGWFDASFGRPPQFLLTDRVYGFAVACTIGGALCGLLLGQVSNQSQLHLVTTIICGAILGFLMLLPFPWKIREDWLLNTVLGAAVGLLSGVIHLPTILSRGIRWVFPSLSQATAHPVWAALSGPLLGGALGAIATVLVIFLHIFTTTDPLADTYPHIAHHYAIVYIAAFIGFAYVTIRLPQDETILQLQKIFKGCMECGLFLGLLASFTFLAAAFLPWTLPDLGVMGSSILILLLIVPILFAAFITASVTIFVTAVGLLHFLILSILPIPSKVAAS